MSSAYPNDDKSTKPLLNSVPPESFIFDDNVYKEQAKNQRMKRVVACCFGAAIACILILICVLVLTGILIVVSTISASIYYLFACDALLLNLNVVKNSSTVDTTILDPTIRFRGNIPGKIYVLPNPRSGSTLIEAQFVNYAKRRSAIGMFDYKINPLGGKEFEITVTANSKFVANTCFQIDVELYIPASSTIYIEGSVNSINVEDADNTGNFISLDSLYFNGSRIDNSRQVLVSIEKAKFTNGLSIVEIKNGIINLRDVECKSTILQTTNDNLIGSISVANSKMDSAFIYSKRNPIFFSSFKTPNQYVFVKTETAPITLTIDKNNQFGGGFSLKGDSVRNFKIDTSPVIRIAAQTTNEISGSIGNVALGGNLQCETVNSNLYLTQAK